MNISEFIEIGRLRSKTSNYKVKKASAIELCRQQLEYSKNPYVSLSGGKDSAAMCYLVNEAAKSCKKDFRIWSHISDASFPGTLETCRLIAQKLGRSLDVYESSGAFEALKKAKKQSFGKSGVFFDSVRQYAADKDLSFVGVRAFESKRRMKSAQVHGQVFYSESMGAVMVCHPLLWFRLEDVAAAMYEYDIPIHPIYYKADIECQKNSLKEDSFIRLSYVTSRDLLNKGTAVFLKYNYPEIYNMLQKAYPDIKQYV